MPITSVYFNNINPQYPTSAVEKLDQVSIGYSGDSGPINGKMILYAQRVDAEGKPLVPADIEEVTRVDLDPNNASSAVNLSDVDLSMLGDARYQFFAVVEQDNGPDAAMDPPSEPYMVDGDDPVCFLAGTRIRTPSGDVPIESLRIGDLVTTVDGAPEPIRFIGRQTYGARFADPVGTWPVLVQAGALGEGVPVVDLMLSPAHALHLDGVLVAALALVNGTTIRQVQPEGDAFAYYNLEFDRHALVLAEGAEAESFADNVERTRFHNHAEFAALYPDGREVGEMDLPRAASVRQVPGPIRRRIAARAEAMAQAEGAGRAA
jgi:hypothetical protein